MSSWDPNHLKIGIIAAPTAVHSRVSQARVLIRLKSFASVASFYKPIAILAGRPRQYSSQARLEEAWVYTNTGVGPSRAGFEYSSDFIPTSRRWWEHCREPFLRILAYHYSPLITRSEPRCRR
jgi:hypothetical protein